MSNPPRKKTFDCVEMKRQAQEIIRARLAGMTREQQLEYWRKRDAELAEVLRQLRQAENEHNQHI
jgi:hypothetical protein